MPNNNDQYILTASCMARTGVVAAVTTFLAEREGYICALQQFDDESTHKFFLRAVFRRQQESPSIDEIRSEFTAVAQAYDMRWKIRDPSVPTKVLIMVSKFDHCLADLLYRRDKDEIPMDITAVVSNHLDLRPMVEREGIRFVHLPVTRDSNAVSSPANRLNRERCSVSARVSGSAANCFSFALCSALSESAKRLDCTVFCAPL